MQKSAAYWEGYKATLIKLGGRTGPVTDLLELIALNISKNYPRLRAQGWKMVHPSKLRQGIMETHQPFGPGSEPTLREMLVGEGPGFLEFLKTLR